MLKRTVTRKLLQQLYHATPTLSVVCPSEYARLRFNVAQRITKTKIAKQKRKSKLPTRFERVTLGSAIPRSTADLRELL